MKKTLLALGSVMAFAVSLSAAEEQQVSIYDSLCQQYPAARNLSTDDSVFLQEACDALGVFSQDSALRFQELKANNPKGYAVFMKLIGADDLIVGLQPVSNAPQARLGDADENEDDQVFLGDEEYDEEV